MMLWDKQIDQYDDSIVYNMLLLLPYVYVFSGPCLIKSCVNYILFAIDINQTTLCTKEIVFSFLCLLHLLFSKRHEHGKVDLCAIQFATIIIIIVIGDCKLRLIRGHAIDSGQLQFFIKQCPRLFNRILHTKPYNSCLEPWESLYNSIHLFLYPNSSL